MKCRAEKGKTHSGLDGTNSNNNNNNRMVLAVMLVSSINIIAGVFVFCMVGTDRMICGHVFAFVVCAEEECSVQTTNNTIT